MKLSVLALVVAAAAGWAFAQFQPPPNVWVNGCTYEVIDPGFAGACEGDFIGQIKCTNCGNDFSNPTVRCKTYYTWSCGTVGQSIVGNNCHTCTATLP